MTGSQFAGLEHSWNGAPSVTQKREIYILMAGGEVKMHSVRKFAFPFCSLNEKLAVIGTCATWTILIKNQIHTHTPSHGQPFYVPAIAPNTHTYTLHWNGSQPQKPYTLSSPAPLSTETVPPMVFDATLDFGRLQVRPQTLYIWAIFACWTMPFIFHIHTHKMRRSRTGLVGYGCGLWSVCDYYILYKTLCGSSHRMFEVLWQQWCW